MILEGVKNIVEDIIEKESATSPAEELLFRPFLHLFLDYFSGFFLNH